MIGPGSAFIIATITFLMYSFIARQELVKGRRFFLSGIRDRFDQGFARTHMSIKSRFSRLYRLTIKLSWYYSIHSTLRALLMILVRMYDRIEAAFYANRERAKSLRAEKKALTVKTHLVEIQEHKEAVALTPRQKKKLKDKILERGK